MFGIKLEETRFYQEAKEEGRQEGLKQAREQGIQQGREEAKRELIPRFLAFGMSMEEVAKLLSLTVEQVRLISEQESSTST
ncbi:MULTISPECIES: aspartate aminotransferase [Nostoc]|uniref:Aspartate aminotransferase n=1 Tax=Nostoc paludosum FACHB-159 TaxID=2692908 RepID=A0ABR8KAI4_9NOSO|nr:MULTISPECIES: aspartate aminotransferase [Nostoc]MBD2679470.1 aspartate aminotransferase [Nostoc sp. FACHB-857]MBD2735729.1 aspartate aminotransferase [Nostoc paludosum FACHB-159]